jgi:hypothetical protein
MMLSIQVKDELLHGIKSVLLFALRKTTLEQFLNFRWMTLKEYSKYRELYAIL